MELSTYVRQLHDQLVAVAETGDPAARAFLDRLVVALEPAARLALLDALSAAAAEITQDLAPGSVEVRLRAGEPEFAVTAPPAEPAAAEPPPAPGPGIDDADDGPMARLNLRLSEQLKARIERAATRQGRSANSWLARAANAALAAEEFDPPTVQPATGRGGRRRQTGWVR
ncbi:toxin-antitoxin system HicB family antitoxin [Actinocatenispora sera]|uniref:HicB-like protein involved in pilus formation n=1 Tax=Actinocatenispora sera TaxID=390989 RepID=A0A810L5F9_9ACTN|nr:toxin-antitoxin system HicB family antitoxin [Actinocatenispora sera]BCJ29348.1 hypothetical protein Asera_34560 [Actinocatenispora sera]